MAGMFDDLVPTQSTPSPKLAAGGMFDDLVPSKKDLPDVGAPLIGDGGQFSSGTELGNNFADSASKTVYGALKNAPHSAYEFARNTIQPIIHPIDTATSLKNLGLGVLEKTGIVPGDEHEKYADAVGQFFADRYGGVENVRKTLETDPVGLAGDLSMLLTGGGAAAGRLPGIAGKVGEAASAAGRVVDPFLAAAPVAKAMTPVAKAIGSGAGRVASEALGVTTGVGSQPLQIAARSGLEGGHAAESFRANMRGQAPLEEAVNDARGALSQMRKERGDSYREAMTNLSTDQKVLNFDKVDEAIRKSGAVKTFKGQDISPTTQGIRHQIADIVDEWRAFDPAEFHTAEGLDALKQKIGDVRDATQFGTPERVVADRVYHGIRQTIIDSAPEYARTMKGYEEASKQIKEIEKTLSINPNASVDKSLRALQKSLRDNVNTSFGRHAELANFLVNSGAPLLMEKLAGQALSSRMPRGLPRLLAAGAVEGPLALAGGVAAAAKAAPALLTMSPRLMGELAHGVGRAARKVAPLTEALPAARQIGQVTSAESPFGLGANPYSQ